MNFKMDDISFSIVPLEDIVNGKKYKISVSIPTRIGWIEDVRFNLLSGNGEQSYYLKYNLLDENCAIFETEIDIETKAIVRYYFSYVLNERKMYITQNGTMESSISQDQMFKASINFDVPDWAKGKMMYHIFVDRFRRGSKLSMEEMPRRTIHKSWNEDAVIGPNEDGLWNVDFYGGDLKGIEESLDYIKSLGVSIIYLSPIVYSQSNHRYDTSDYERVDPYVGSNEDLRSLCDAAHRKGMRVILDAVFNHTGNDSKYFNELGSFENVGAFQSPDSPYYKFYRTHQMDGREAFDYWWGMTNLPVCNGNSLEWKEYILGENGIIDQWFRLGIDGLRLDVADELTDEFIEGIRIAVKRNKQDGFIIGEVWKNPMRMGRGYIESGKGMDSVMNYSLVDAIIRYFKYGDVDKLAYIIRDIKNEYPDGTIQTLMNFTSTHDISRAINIFGSNEFQQYGEWAWNPNNGDVTYCRDYQLSKEQYKYGREVLEAYVFLLTFMPGILSIFYGDEVGIQGLGNLANRKSYPWDRRDKKLLEFYRMIGKIRRNESFLETADLEIFDINKDLIMFERTGDKEKALVVVSRSSEGKEFGIPSEYERDESGIYTLKKSRKGLLMPYGGVAIKKDK